MTLARRARLAAGLSPDELAELIGVEPALYLSWENGGRRPGPLASSLLRLIEADPEFCSRTLRRTGPASVTGTILIVVDHEEARAAFWELCEEEGLEVVAVSNGWQAIEHLKSSEVVPCAIVLDVTVPVINGWQLMSWLRHQDEPLSGVPLITLSADPGHAEVALRDGVARHFSKPLDFSAILAEVKQHCRAA